MFKDRYVATIELYVYADSDLEAENITKAYTQILNNKYDMNASVVWLKKQQWGNLNK